MYSKIVVATDGSELSIRSLRTAAFMARQEKAAVTVVTVTSGLIAAGYGTMGSAAAEVIVAQAEAEKLHANDVLQAARTVLLESGITADYVHVPDREPADGIIQVCEKVGAGLIIMGSHGRRGLQRLLLGSEATHVLTLSKVPVLIVK